MSYEIEWYRGDSYPKGYVITDIDTQLPIDITGYSFKFTVDSRKNPTDETTKIFQVVGAPDIDPTTGKVTFTPSPSHTDIAPGSYYYDIQMIDPSLHIRTIRKDKFKVVQDITK
jgi:hypothetical protein